MKKHAIVRHNARDAEQHTLTVAIAGNPNAGKTTLFNLLTGARQHVGNWPGVTVEKKEGLLEYQGSSINVVDLPGTYSLTAYSMEEVIARNYICRQNPDVVVNIVDASNLERNLYLTMQLLELGAPMIIALNMVDVAESRGIQIDHELLGKLLGLPVVPMVARTGKGRDELLQTILSQPEQTQVRIPYGHDIDNAISRLIQTMEQKAPGRELRLSDRMAALKILENDSVVECRVKNVCGDDVIALRDRLATRIEQHMGDDPETLIVDRRYGYISGLIREVVSRPALDRRTLTDQIDAVLTNRVLGLPFLMLAMWGTFQITFKWGAPPMEWLDSLVVMLSSWLNQTLPDSLLRSLVVDGAIGGVGGVIVFIPNILFLFFAIALLEDTGYMARAAFIMDKVMHKLHLHGKSFIPMLVGFGCSVPAIMAARTLENEKDRIVTILVTPLMSCGARLPVYVLLAGAFFSPAAAGNVIFSIYLIGILFAILLARIFRTTLLKGDTTPFVMELPPYRLPTLRSVLLHMWERAWLYIKKAGTTILGIALIIWALMSFPQTFPGQRAMEQKQSRIQQQLENSRPGSKTREQLNQSLEQLQTDISSQRLRYSYAGRLGRALEPVLRPIGFDWKTGVALISGFAAKEVVVSTMGTIYSIGHTGSSSGALGKALKEDPIFRPLTAYVLMLFVLLTVPCMATVAVILRETNSWKWTAFSLGYHTLLAWCVCFVVYQVGCLFGL